MMNPELLFPASIKRLRTGTPPCHRRCSCAPPGQILRIHSLVSSCRILILLLLCLPFCISGCLDAPRESPQLCILPRATVSRGGTAADGARNMATISFEERLLAIPADILTAFDHAPLRPANSLLRPWAYIVLHHSATTRGGAASFDKMHKARGWDGLGYHFVIGNGTESKDGEIEIGFRWLEQREGAHAGNSIYNQLGIGICLVGNFETAQPTAKQLASLSKLLRFLAALLAIPPSNITMHRIVREDETACPGKLFPFSQVVGSVEPSKE